MFEIGRDDVVARLDSPLIAMLRPSVQLSVKIQRSGASPWKNWLSRAAVSSSIARPPRPCDARPGRGWRALVGAEAVEGLVDRLGLGKAGGGVVEVDHGIVSGG